MLDVYRLCRPLIFTLDPEKAHKLSVQALRVSSACGLLSRSGGDGGGEQLRLQQTVFGLPFDNPIGLAAGFDKHAEVIDGALGLGFGFVEAGTVTLLPQPGNPRPRLFRLTDDKGVINRFGFNSKGHEVALAHMQRRLVLGKKVTPGIVGVNIGANKETTNRSADYVALYRAFAPIADYITVNISSPNTPGLRDLQSGGQLGDLLSVIVEAKHKIAQGGDKTPPILVKIAPDLEVDELAAIIETATEHSVDGLIVTNTMIARPPLHSFHGKETGGLSGKPLFAPSTAMLARAYKFSQGRIPIVGAGGVFSAQDAFDKITAGASLVQLYSALIYEGPGLVRRLVQGLDEILADQGFASVTDAVGVNAGVLSAKI